MQATLINLSHQRTELPTNKHNKKSTGKSKPYKTPENQVTNQVKKLMTVEKHIRCQTAVINVVIPFMYRDSNALQRSTNAKYATNTATFQVYVIRRKLRHITRAVAETQCISTSCRPIYAQDSSNHSHSEDSSSDESFCLQLQIQSNHAEGK